MSVPEGCPAISRLEEAVQALGYPLQALLVLQVGVEGGGHPLEAVDDSPPAGGDGGRGVAVTTVEEGAASQLHPRVASAQQGIVGDHGRVVPAAAPPAAVAHRAVERVPLLHAVLGRERGRRHPVRDASLLQVFSPLLLEVVPVRQDGMEWL